MIFKRCLCLLLLLLPLGLTTAMQLTRDLFAPSMSSHPFHFSNLTTALIPVHYLKASTLLKFINQPGMHLLSKQGHLSAYANRNMLWMRDWPQNIRHLQRLVHRLDQPEPQILIKTRIVQVDNQFVKSLGVLFATQQQSSSKKSLFSSNLPQSNALNHVIIPIASFKQGILLNLQLSALIKEGHAQMISSPELIAINRHSAWIEAGEEVPYQEATSSGATSVAFKKAVLRLKVTPEIMPHHTILLSLNVNQDKVSPLTVNGVPAIQTQQLHTTIRVHDQQTLVLGGIYERDQSIQHQGIPGLRKIPILGALFRHRRRVNKQSQLLIFVTPTIIQARSPHAKIHT